jgi:hypothetical protein
MSDQPLEFELIEVQVPIMPANLSDKVARMIEKAFEQHGRGSWTRTELWIKENYGEWYDYLQEESPH